MKKTIYTFFALLAITATGCKDDFFDINDNPNAPTEESITPELILPRALHASGLKMATSYDYAAHWMGYWARSGNYGTSAEQESYNITTTFQQDEWGTETSSTGWYDILADVNTMEKKATAGGAGFYAGAAKVLKSIGFMYLVDQYNNVPYSKAFDLVGNILPAYDKGPDIYNDLFVQLDEAQALIAAAEIDATAYNADILFGYGATQKAYSSAFAESEKLMWRKLINTMRLKLLIHESQVVSAATVSAVTAKINADGSGFLGAGQTASVQPGYQAADLQQNPFWDTYKTTALGATDQYNRANNYVLNKFRNNDDIRYQYFFSPAQTPLNGNVYYGYNFGEVIPNSAPKAVNSSDVAGPGLAKSASQPQWFFTSVESMFLQAEAIQRGWISGNAEDAYRAAVRESFAWLGVPNAVATANAYLGQDLALVSWSRAATSADKIRLIVMQKYLALVGVNNFEAYVDYRRLGVPTDLPLSLYSGRNNNKIPLRMQYPQNEYNYNPSNVGAEGVINPQTSRIFWDTE